MKVPTLDLPRVSPQAGGAPRLRTEHAGGFSELNSGLQALGSVSGQIVEQEQAKAAESRQKAQAAESLEAETEWNRYRTEQKYGRRGSGDARRDAIEQAFTGEQVEQPGLFNLQGDDAFKASTGAYAGIEKKRQEIADGMSDEEAKKLFLSRTGKLLDHDYAEIESYAGKQRRVADLATLDARKESALDAVRSNPDNLAEADTQAIALEGPIKAFGLSDDDRAAKVKEWHGQVAAEQIRGQLERGNWEAAEVILQNKNALLSDKARSALAAAVEKQKGAGAADAAASRIVAGSTNERGEIDQARALKALNELPPAEQQKVRPVLFQRMTEQEQAYAADTKRISTAAFSVYNQVGWAKFSGTQLADDLNSRNPELYNRLENDARVEWERLERKKRGTAEDRKWQADRDEIARNIFMSLPPEVRAQTDLEEWSKGRGLSEVGKSDLGPLKESARQVVEKGQAAGENEFVNRAKADAEATFPVGTSKAEKDARIQQERVVEAKARQWFSQWLVSHEGKPPTDEDIAKASSAIAIDQLKLPPGAGQAAKDVVRMGGGRARVLPEMDFTGGEQPAPTMIRVKNKKTGAMGRMPEAKFNPDTYERLDG